MGSPSSAMPDSSWYATARAAARVECKRPERSCFYRGQRSEEAVSIADSTDATERGASERAHQYERREGALDRYVMGIASAKEYRASDSSRLEAPEISVYDGVRKTSTRGGFESGLYLSRHLLPCETVRLNHRLARARFFHIRGSICRRIRENERCSAGNLRSLI